jgi:hypothetical protein
MSGRPVPEQVAPAIQEDAALDLVAAIFARARQRRLEAEANVQPVSIEAVDGRQSGFDENIIDKSA